MRTVRFGIIGCGMMGREFASAAARWLHLPEMTIRPEIVAVCNRTLDTPKVDWFRENIPTLTQVTSDYRELLGNPEVEAVYIAVPHNLHEEFYTAALEAGKHLMGEKPFGIDLEANEAILAAVRRHPECFVRCSSQFVFFPAVQRIGRMIEAGAFGRIIEVNAGFLHGSDLDPQKPINWKRMIEFNGEYGVMGDLGPHVCTVPFRAGWTAQERPGGPVQHRARAAGRQRRHGPVRDVGQRHAPVRGAGPGFGQRLSLHPANAADLARREEQLVPRDLRDAGLRAITASTRPTRSNCSNTPGGEQAWQKIGMGHEMTYRSITGEIFQCRRLRCDPADVGGVPVRAGARRDARPVRRLRHARRERAVAQAVHRRPEIPNRRHDRVGTPADGRAEAASARLSGSPRDAEIPPTCIWTIQFDPAILPVWV